MPRRVVSCPWLAARRQRRLAEMRRLALHPRALWFAHRWARVIHVILDDCVIHKTARVEQLLREMSAKIQLHFLPLYCPNDDRIERLWQVLHANVTRNHRHRTMPDPLAAALHGLEARISVAEEYADTA